MAWLEEMGIKFQCVTIFPAKPFFMDLYLKDLNSASYAALIVSTVYSIWWVHKVAGEPSTTDHEIVKFTMEDYKHLLARPVQPKDHVAVDDFPKLVKVYGRPEADI